MRFREHRGELAESMATVVELEPTVAALCEHINRLAILGQVKITPRMVHFNVCPYDPRVDWHTCWVFVRGFGVIGCIDHETGVLIP